MIALVVVLSSLLSVVDIASKALASRLQRIRERRAVGASWLLALRLCCMPSIAGGADPADRLRTTTLSGFEQLSGPWRTFADNIYRSNEQDIERQDYDRTKQIMENTYGRGLGLSSIAAQMQVERERARSEALIKARRDADVAGQQAQLAALSQAAQVAQEEMRRRQQASQFGERVGLEKKALRQQESAANMRAVATGLSGLGRAGGELVGRTFQPEISKWIRSKAGLDRPTTTPGGLSALGGDPGPDIAPGATLDMAAAGAPMTTTAAPSFDVTPTTSTDFGAGSYEYPSTASGFEMLGSGGGSSAQPSAFDTYLSGALDYLGSYDTAAFSPFDAMDWGDYGGSGFDWLSAWQPQTNYYSSWGYM